MPSIVHLPQVPLAPRQGAPDAFQWQASADLAAAAGLARLRLNLRSLSPRRFSYPYHFHHHIEEVFLIVEGEATLRTPDGLRVVRAGDLLLFETGPASAHQLYNHSGAPCRYLDLTTVAEADVCEYPDSGKVGLLPLRILVRPEPLDYYDGEQDPAAHWPEETVGPPGQRG